jgi:hypothetical protein
MMKNGRKIKEKKRKGAKLFTHSHATSYSYYSPHAYPCTVLSAKNRENKRKG